jgi:hypothetical protein
MMFKLRIGGEDVLLNPDQLNALANLLESTTHYVEKHVGKGQGFVGYENSYVPEMEPYNVTKSFSGFTLLTDKEVDMFATLQALRLKENQS